MIAQTPSPPYYAVIFTSTLKTASLDYEKMSELMIGLAKKQDGYLGIEHARSAIGITISYWQDLSSIQNWRHHTEHQLAQKKGIKEWYKNYQIRICKVEQAHHFSSHQ